MNYRLAMFRDRERESVKIESAMFVDPGMGGTGWAYFENFDTKPKFLMIPVSSGVISITRRPGPDTWITHIQSMAAHFVGTITAHQPRLVVLEQPELWSGDAKSHAATVSGSKGEPGDLFKLTYLIGQLGYIVMEKLGVNPVIIHPHEWKGQLSKELVFERLAKLGIKPKDHEADAIGMGIAAQGML